MFGTSDTGSTGAVEHDMNLVNRLAHHFKRIQQSRSGDNCRPVLIVVEHWDLHRLLQCLFDVEALGRLDVFKIDASECRLQQLANLDDVVGIVAVHFKIEHVHVGKAFE